MSERRTPLLTPGATQPASNTLARGELRAALANAIDHARVSQRQVGVLMIALARSDRLDAILGVPPAEIMQHALDRLRAALRPTDKFLRLSDEKLCVILPNLKSTALAALAAHKVHQVLEAEYFFGEAGVAGSAHVRPVIGIATFPDHAANAEQLLVHADIAKRIARSREVSQHVFQSNDQGDVDAYLGLEIALRDALRANQLEVHYQPQVNFRTGKCHAVEALLRWTHPENGPVAAATIVRVAEANGIVGQLTAGVLNTALRHQADWRREGVDLEVAVNLSTIALIDSELPDMIAQAIGTWDADPAMLTMEITESASIEDADLSLAVMQRLKKMGIRLSVDDFGTGHSSLSYVKKFPLDELKIDKLFIQNMRTIKGDQQIVRSVIDLAHNFELRVVAEGIEDEATYKDLKKMGCDLAQGYFLSRAIPANDLLPWLKTR